MNKLQIFGIIRHTLTFIGGVLVINGILDEGLVSELSGAVMTLVAGIWSIVEKKDN